MTPRFVAAQTASACAARPGRFGVHQVRWQQQNAVGARIFSGSGELLCHCGSVTATCQHGNSPSSLLHGGGYDRGKFVQRQREELTGSSCREEPSTACTPAAMRCVRGTASRRIRNSLVKCVTGKERRPSPIFLANSDGFIVDIPVSLCPKLSSPKYTVQRRLACLMVRKQS